ncbi:MAG: hypothetical protein HY691_08575 [Chloroflexi bacterium]|nr:hypothetical protein [Chloroflexota bacterium]
MSDADAEQAADLIRTLAAVTQQALWATLALKALHELLAQRGLVGEADIVAHTNAVIERDWNEAVRQLLPPALVPLWQIDEPTGFARLRFGPIEPGPAGGAG